MRTSVRSLSAIAGCLGLAATHAAVLNDGTTTDNLGRVQNAFGRDGTTTTATVTAEGTIAVAQSAQGFPFPSLRTAWYSTTLVPSGGEYTVSADFTPAAANDERRGGVIGWLDKTAGSGIGFHVRPGGFSRGFRVNSINFNAEDSNENESLTGLYNTDGTAAVGTTNSAQSELTDAYDPTLPATFELVFSAPSTAEQAALKQELEILQEEAGIEDPPAIPDNPATAKVTAKVFQTIGGEVQQIGRTIELLTTQPQPETLTHRVGYYAYWGSIFAAGSDIGALDNLDVDGDFEAPPENTLPTVSLAAPSEGVNQTPPGAFTLTAEASDADGNLELVEILFADTGELLAEFTEAPFTFQWSDVPSGNYSILARATDNCGGTSETEPIALRVNRQPRAVITSPAESAIFDAPVTIPLTANVSDLDGQIVSVTWLSNGTDEIATVTEPPFSFDWVDAPAGVHILTARVTDNLGDTGESFTATITINEATEPPVDPMPPVDPEPMPPTGGGDIPTLSISLDSGLLTISWATDAGDFVLESTSDLTTWTAEATQANPFLVVPEPGAQRYYRLQPAP